MKRGNIVIIAMVFVAVAMATFAWWYRFRTSQRVLGLWGVSGILLIQKPEEVEAQLLQSADAGGKQTGESTSGNVKIGTEQFTTGDQIPLLGQPGFLHAKQTLLEEITFLWDQEVNVDDCDWEYLLTFRGGGRELQVAFAPNQRALINLDSNRARKMGVVADRLAAYVQQRAEAAEAPGD